MIIVFKKFNRIYLLWHIKYFSQLFSIDLPQQHFLLWSICFQSLTDSIMLSSNRFHTHLVHQSKLDHAMFHKNRIYSVCGYMTVIWLRKYVCTAKNSPCTGMITVRSGYIYTFQTVFVVCAIYIFSLWYSCHDTPV